jgi:hypothetical protein
MNLSIKYLYIIVALSFIGNIMIYSAVQAEKSLYVYDDIAGKVEIVSCGNRFFYNYTRNSSYEELYGADWDSCKIVMSMGNVFQIDTIQVEKEEEGLGKRIYYLPDSRVFKQIIANANKAYWKAESLKN